MKNLVVCFGYDLDRNGKLPSLLKNRLDEVIKLLQDTNNEALLMGSASYRDGAHGVSQASAMKGYLLKFGIAEERIHLEEQTGSAIEQLCYIRKLLDRDDLMLSGFDTLIFISTEGFNDRVKLYAEYIFDDLNKFQFIGAKLPDGTAEAFIAAEKEKLAKAKIWLSNHTKGDYLAILNEQLAFQANVKANKIEHPRS